MKHLLRLETVADLLSSRSNGTEICLVDEQIKLSWTNLFEKSRSLASGLAELGVSYGDRVAIWLPNRAAWLISFFACAQLGAIAVSINTRFRSAEVGDLLGRSGSKLLIYWPGYKAIDFDGILSQCSSEALDKLEKLVLYKEDDFSLPDSIAGKPVRAFSELLSRPQIQNSYGKSESPCIIFTTSGTTKAPKLVVHSQRNILNHAYNVKAQYGLTSNDKFLLLPPFCGVYGFCSAMAAMVSGARLILTPAWNAAGAADLIETHSISHLTASNEAVSQLFETRTAEQPFPSISFIAAANLNPAHANITALGEMKAVKIVGLYGSSEMQALFSLSDRESSTEARGRAGGYPASVLAKIRARDPETQKLCDVGQAGELEFHAPESCFVEYFNDPIATKNAFTDDGYFKSGDLGSVERDGSFIYLARMGDTLRLGGFLVSPVEIEELLQEYSSVASCQIVGVKVGGAIRPIAFVIARHDAEINEADIIKYAAERLAKYKVPVKIYTVGEFPTTPSANGSKVQKNKLREMAEYKLSHFPVEDDSGL